MTTENTELTTQEPQTLTVGEAYEFAKVAYKSGLFQDAKDEAQAVVKVMAGRELGIPPMMALNKLFLVQNKIGMAAEVATLLLQRSGYKITHAYDDRDNPTACEVTLSHPNRVPSSFSWRFTMQDAKRANLVKPDSSWAKYPQDLLYARALMGASRKFAPGCLGGMGYGKEELESLNGYSEPVDVPQPEVSPSTTPQQTLADTAKEVFPGATEVSEDASPESYKELSIAHGVSLERCWVHGKDWHTNKFDKLCHKIHEGGWCNFREVLKPIVGKVSSLYGWDANAFTEWLKENKGGRTWSKIPEPEQVQILNDLLKAKEQANA